MRPLTAVAVAVVFSLAFVPAASAATYYVSTTGNDAAPGSPEAPFATITRAAQVAVPGDVVNVRAGIYAGTVTINSKGTAAAPIVFRAMPGETAILDGAGTSSTRPIVDIVTAEYVDFSGFEVRNSPYIGIVLWHVRNIRILDNHIHHTTRNGIYVGGDTPIACYDITVSGNNVHDTVLENQNHAMSRGGWAGAVVVSRTERSTITNNRIWNNDGEGIISLRSNYAQIRNNEVSDSFSVNLYFDNARFATVDRNLVYSGNARYYRDGRPAAGISVANERKDVMNPSSDNLFTNNIVIGTRWGFHYGNYESGGGLKNTKVLNNTFYGSMEEILRIDDDAHANSLVANNIFYQVGSPAPSRVGTGLVTYQTNLWYGGSAGPAASVSDIIGNPMLSRAGGFAAVDYKLTSPSPAIASGASLPIVAQDFWGSSRGPLFDVGAHQFTGALPPGPPDTELPAAPGNLMATAAPTLAAITLTWSAATDNVGVTGYTIQRNGTQVAIVSGTTWTDSGLAWSTTYQYTVSALDAAGNKSPQASASATTAVLTDFQAPTVPGNFDATAGNSTQVRMTWTASSDNIGVTGYRIYRDGVYLATVTGTAWTDPAVLQKRTTYTYAISAVDAAGNESAKATDTTKTGNKS